MGQTRFTTENFILGTSTVGNEQVKAAANVDVSKLKHLYKAGTGFALAIGGTVATREEIVFVASTAGTIRGFYCTFNVGGTTGDSDFVLNVNGVSVLSGAVNFAHGDPDTSVESGTISTPALAVDDIVSISVTRNSSHDGTGPYAWVEIEETAA